MGGYTKERAGERISELAGRGLDLVTLWQEATEVLRATVPHFMSPCWFTLDPASLLITSHYQKEIVEFPPEWLAHAPRPMSFDDAPKYDKGMVPRFARSAGL